MKVRELLEQLKYLQELSPGACEGSEIFFWIDVPAYGHMLARLDGASVTSVPFSTEGGIVQGPKVQLEGTVSDSGFVDWLNTCEET